VTPQPDPDFDRAEPAAWEQTAPNAVATLTPIDWPDFWNTDVSADDWLIEPIVARGRQTAVYSMAKTGKSLLALDMAASAAMGRSILGHQAKDPVEVMYVDLEMTEADLRERLTDLGYGPDDDLSRLHYFQLPELPGLDRDLGGEILVATALAKQVQLVVIDTMARAVQGGENDADTYRGFYWYTGRRLKTAGIALLRLDHQGKDSALGQRGSSAKVDDVDIVFKLTQVDTKTLKLTRTHTRVPWVPSEVTIVREESPILRHVWADDFVPAGTRDAMLALDELGVPLDASAETALTSLRRSGRGQRKAVVLAALKARRRDSK
jgi:RecA-family ATPase